MEQCEYCHGDGIATHFYAGEIIPRVKLDDIVCWYCKGTGVKMGKTHENHGS